MHIDMHIDVHRCMVNPIPYFGQSTMSVSQCSFYQQAECVVRTYFFLHIYICTSLLTL